MSTESKVKALSAEFALNGDDEPNGLRLTFGNGAHIYIDDSMLTPKILNWAMYHGLKQKLIDAAAISRNPDTGKSATVEDKYNAVKVIFDRICSGEWNSRGESDGTGTGGILFRALCRFYDGKKPPDAIREFLSKKSLSDQAALRKHPPIARIIEEIKIENAKPSSVDASALLDELE